MSPLPGIKANVVAYSSMIHSCGDVGREDGSDDGHESDVWPVAPKVWPVALHLLRLMTDERVPPNDVRAWTATPWPGSGRISIRTENYGVRKG